MSTRTPFTKPGYELLCVVLSDAFNQAAHGKGHDRHANGEAFEKQVMADMARRFGIGALLGQAFKKSEESQRLPYVQARRELLGAINYIAGAVLELDRINGKTTGKDTPTEGEQTQGTATGGQVPQRDPAKIGPGRISPAAAWPKEGIEPKAAEAAYDQMIARERQRAQQFFDGDMKRFIDTLKNAGIDVQVFGIPR